MFKINPTKEPSQILFISDSVKFELLTASGTELNVVSLVVMDTSLGQHSVVLDFGAAELWGVVGQDNQLSFALIESVYTSRKDCILTLTELTNSLAVAQVVLAGLDDQLET